MATPIHATITCLGVRSPSAGGPTIYRVEACGFMVDGAEPVRPLCRRLCHAGHAGKIEFHDATTGKLRFSIARLEMAARFRLSEGDAGIQRLRWHPHPRGAAAWEHELDARFRGLPVSKEAPLASVEG